RNGDIRAEHRLAAQGFHARGKVGSRGLPQLVGRVDTECLERGVMHVRRERMGNRVADYTSMAHTSPLSSGSVGGDAIAVRDEVAGQEASALALLPIRMLLTGVCVVLLERVGEDMRAGLVTGRDEIE